MKFDIIIGNPPYKNGLHLKFLNEAINNSNRFVVFIEPVQFLLNEKSTRRKNIETELYKKLEKYGFYVKIFNGNKFFKDASFLAALGYLIIDKNNKQLIKVDDYAHNKFYVAENIDEISTYGNSEVYKSLKNKILSYAKLSNVEQYRNKDINKGYYVNFASIRGHINTNNEKIQSDDYLTILQKDEYVKNFKDNANFIEFETEEEANNFIEYLKTNFARFALGIYKKNQHLDAKELEAVPYFTVEIKYKKSLSYKQKITDEVLYEFFELTNDEIKFIEDHIPKYY